MGGKKNKEIKEKYYLQTHKLGGKQRQGKRNDDLGPGESTTGIKH